MITQMLWAGGAAGPTGPTMLFALNAEDVDQYTMTPDWDASAIVYTTDSLAVARLGYEVRCSFVSPDGARLYVSLGEIGNSIIDQYDLTTAGDISTGTLVGTLDVWAEGLQVYAVSFSPDGTKMYTGSEGTGDRGDANQWTLATAWDIETATLADTAALAES